MDEITVYCDSLPATRHQNEPLLFDWYWADLDYYLLLPFYLKSKYILFSIVDYYYFSHINELDF